MIKNTNIDRSVSIPLCKQCEQILIDYMVQSLLLIYACFTQFFEFGSKRLETDITAQNINPLLIGWGQN